MSASAEVEQLVAAEVTVAGEPKKQAEKPIKEKKPKAPKVPKEKKPKQPKTAVHHPPYFQVSSSFFCLLIFLRLNFLLVR